VGDVAADAEAAVLGVPEMSPGPKASLTREMETSGDHPGMEMPADHPYVGAFGRALRAPLRRRARPSPFEIAEAHQIDPFWRPDIDP
jgi:hypothetical protein